jgi:hypothetical protein
LGVGAKTEKQKKQKKKKHPLVWVCIAPPRFTILMEGRRSQFLLADTYLVS